MSIKRKKVYLLTAHVLGFFFSKKDPDVFTKVIGNLVMLLQDDNVAVSKKVMLSMSNLYRVAFQVKQTSKY